MIKNFDEMQKLGKDNVDVTLKSFGVLSKATQTIATEVADYSKKSFEDGTKVRFAKRSGEVIPEKR